jgi:hypothetical protein
VYSTVLTIHSWVRWAALLLAVGATINAYRRDIDLSRKPPGARWDTFLMAAVDVQALLGLVLYFGLSPFTTEAFHDVGAAMGNAGLRFWVVEHLTAMVGAIVVVRVGRVLALNAQTPAARRRRRLWSFGATTLMLIIGIPWPGLPYGRPLFRV